MIGPTLNVENVRKHFPGSGEVLAGISFRQEPNEFLTIFGPNGCGKTTLVRILAGLEKPDSGEVSINGMSSRDTRISRAVVFQDYALFDWKTARQNVEFGLMAKGAGRTEQRRIAQDYIDLVELTGHEEKYPVDLSGGLKQRCAIARALAVEPRLLLLDEPFAALDSEVRFRLHELILKLWERHRRTILAVTHDPEEAVYLSDRVLVLSAAPSVVQRDIRIELPRPRNHDIRFRPDFKHYLDEIRGGLTTMRSIT